jgi:hypothetical protein
VARSLQGRRTRKLSFKTSDYRLADHPEAIPSTHGKMGLPGPNSAGLLARTARFTLQQLELYCWMIVPLHQREAIA